MPKSSGRTPPRRYSALASAVTVWKTDFYVWNNTHENSTRAFTIKYFTKRLTSTVLYNNADLIFFTEHILLVYTLNPIKIIILKKQELLNNVLLFFGVLLILHATYSITAGYVLPAVRIYLFYISFVVLPGPGMLKNRNTADSSLVTCK